MGCYSSAFANDSDKLNGTVDAYYTAEACYRKKQKTASKNSFASNISNGSSSGVSSACTSPSRSSCSLSSASNPESNSLKAKNHCNISVKRRDFSTAFDIQSICDDFGEGHKMQYQQESRSFGYYSESISTESGASTASQSCLRRTQDTSLPLESPPVTVTPIPGYLEMEMYMMSHSQRLLSKTSSPILYRKNVTFDAMAAASPPSHSYQKWVNYLQNTPIYMLHNVTDIPEAIAGHFSPLDFPPFTDLEEMESAAKRFKVDINLDSESDEDVVYYQKQIPKASNITTEL